MRSSTYSGVPAYSPYLVDHAGRLSLNTLRQRLAALAQWHQDQGFPDPTKAPLVKKVLKGIAALHPAREKRAKPLQLEHITVSPGEGMTLFLPRSKTDRTRVGRTCKAPALSRLCPVAAYQDWVANAGLTEGPVFRRIDRWGRVGQRPLHRDSITALLRERFRILSERPSKNG
jgi:hypothetical protein